VVFWAENAISGLKMTFRALSNLDMRLWGLKINFSLKVVFWAEKAISGLKMTFRALSGLEMRLRGRQINFCQKVVFWAENAISGPKITLRALSDLNIRSNQNHFFSQSGISSWKRYFRESHVAHGRPTSSQASKWGCEASKSTFVKKWYFKLKTPFQASQ